MSPLGWSGLLIHRVPPALQMDPPSCTLNLAGRCGLERRFSTLGTLRWVDQLLEFLTRLRKTELVISTLSSQMTQSSYSQLGDEAHVGLKTERDVVASET